MDKKTSATLFFEKLGEDAAGFITQMIQAEMDEGIIELFNQVGGKLEMNDMTKERYQASLMIIGYLVRAYEEAGREASAPQQ